MKDRHLFCLCSMGDSQIVLSLILFVELNYYIQDLGSQTYHNKGSIPDFFSCLQTMKEGALHFKLSIVGQLYI